jgi:hypothetical protein
VVLLAYKKNNMGFDKKYYDDIWGTVHRHEYCESLANSLISKHGNNLAKNRWRLDQFRDKSVAKTWKEAEEIPFWGKGGNLIWQGSQLSQ